MVYPENKRKIDHTMDEKEKNIPSYNGSESVTLQEKEGKKLLIVLNKVEYLPAMMTLVQLIQPIPTPPRIEERRKSLALATITPTPTTTTTTTITTIPPITNVMNTSYNNSNTTNIS